MAYSGFETFDYGIENDDPFSLAVSESLVGAKNKFAEKDPLWEKILGSVLKYGKQVVDILVSSNVIKNANLSTLTSASYNKGALDALIAVNNGNITDKAPSQITIPATTPTRSSLFDLSNPIVIIAIIVIVYLLFFSKK